MHPPLVVLPRHRARRAILGVVLLLAAIAIPGRATAAEAPELLAGTTVIVGDQAAVMRVRAPAAFSLAGERVLNPDVTIDGEALYAGVVLASEALDGPRLVAGGPETAVSCTVDPCTASRLTYVDATTDPIDGSSRRFMPAGDYLLFLITDGTPVRITLRLAELGDGTVELAPHAAVAPSLVRLAQPSSPAGNFSWVAGESQDAGERGVVISWHVLLWLSPHVASQIQNCTYLGAPDPTLAFETGCPGGQAIVTDCDELVVAVAPHSKSCDATTWGVAGPIGQGWNHKSVGALAKVSSGGVWLSLDPPAGL